MNNVADSQYGACKGRGTDFASHASMTFLAFSRMFNMSCCILFIDLSKAFDMAIRQVVMGFNKSARKNPVAELISLGLTAEQANALASEIGTEGCILDRINTDPEIVQVIRSLHIGFWFQFKESDTILCAKIGGIQGCKTGAIIFNLFYARSLKLLQCVCVLCNHGIVLHVRQQPGPFWHSTNEQTQNEKYKVEQSPEYVPFADATFVDDIAIFLRWMSAIKLLEAIAFLLHNLVEVFEGSGFVINFRKM